MASGWDAAELQETFGDGEGDGIRRDTPVPVKDFSVIIIDARLNMHAQASTRSQTQLVEAMGAVCKFLRQKAGTGDSAKIAVILAGVDSATFGSESASVSAGSSMPEHDSNFRVVQLTRLETPSVDSIKRLQAYVDDPTLVPKHMTSGHGPSFLGEAITKAQNLFDRAKAGRRDVRRISIFTNDERPMDHEAVRSKMADIRDGFLVHLYAIRPPGGGFDRSLFWAGALPRPSQAQDEEEEEEDNADDEDDGVLDDFDSIVMSLRKREHRKRVASRMLFTLAPGVHLSVGLYHNIAAAKRPGYQWKVSHNGEMVSVNKVRTHTETATGASVAASALVKGVRVGDSTAFVSAQEAKEASKVRTAEVGSSSSGRAADADAVKVSQSIYQKGLHLLGFQPRATLRETDNMQHAILVYPSESDVKNSSVAFRALWQRMIERGVVAIVRYIGRHQEPPVLWALLPEREKVDDNGCQTWPPGLYGIRLPYADDFRHIPVEPPVTSSSASVEAEAAAARLVSAYTVSDAPTWDLESAELMNPSLQRFYQVLESQALRLPEPALDAAKPELKALGSQDLKPELTEYLSACSSSIAVAAGKAKGSGSSSQLGKRKAADLAPSEHDEGALARDGRLHSLKLDDLKDICRKRGLKLTGKKDELVARIEDDLAKRQG